MRIILLGWSVVTVMAFSGCEDKSDSTPRKLGGSDPRSSAIDLRMSRIEGLPGEVYRSQANSPIRWQPWTKKSMKLAKDSGRLVLAVIVMPQQPSFKATLQEFAENRVIVEEMNQSYVPVLIDGNAVREIGIFTADLCAEIGSGLQLPLMVWMTPEANPVAWIPLPGNPSASLEGLFMQSHSMVGRMWVEDREYVESNSKMDQENRRQRMISRLDSREMSKQPELDSVKALRQLTSFYDPLSRTFDEAGGLFPSGSLDLLSRGARMEGLPDSVREKSESVLDSLLSDLLGSAMFDRLDGGVFSSRRGSVWVLPGFYRDCSTQARVVSSLMNAYEVTGNEVALERAMGVLKFAEENFRTPDGLFSLGSEYRGPTEDWLWHADEVVRIVNEEEFDVWALASGIKEIGNLPSEVDPRREFFRANSLRYSKSAAQVAEETGLDLGTVEERISSARRKLLKAREERLMPAEGFAEANGAATFRMVSAYASVYRVTGEERFKVLAVETLEKGREYFSDGPRLKLYAGDFAPSLVAARAFVYGLAIMASLDVHAITAGESWLGWADDLATTAAETFATPKYLRECPPEADLIDLPIADNTMIFDDSTAGLFSMAEARMDDLGKPMLKPLVNLVTVLPEAAALSPVLYTDLIQGSLMREYGGGK